MRLKQNKVLAALAAAYLECGQPRRQQCYELQYRAEVWDRKRRVILVIQPRPNDLFPKHYFLTTDQSKEVYPAELLVELYQKRGKAEKHQGEWKAACTLSLSSSPRNKSRCQDPPVTQPNAEQEQVEPEPVVYAHNAAMLQLYVLVYALLHMGRCLMHEPHGPYMSLTTFRKEVLKVGARIVVHARYIVIKLASSAIVVWQRFWQNYSRMQWVSIPCRC